MTLTANALVRFADVETHEESPITFVVQPTASAGTFCFGLQDRPHGHLRFRGRGIVDFEGGVGQWAQFTVHTHEHGVSLQNVGTSKWVSVLGGQIVSSEESRPLTAIVVGSAQQTRGPKQGPRAGAAAVPLPEGWEEGKEFGLVHAVDSRVRLPHVFRVERAPGRSGAVCLALVEDPVRHLRVQDTGNVDYRGGKGAWAQFIVEAHTNNNERVFSLRSVGNEGKQSEQGAGWHIGVRANAVYGKCGNGPEGQWRQVAPDDLPVVVDFDENVKLEDSQLHQFVRDGYLVIRNACPRELVDNVLRCINNQLGTATPWKVDDDPLNQQLQLGGGVPRCAAIRDLFFQSPAWTIAQRLMGKGRVRRPDGAQVALRFPSVPEQIAEIDPRESKQYHLDGMGKGLLAPFTLLFGISLSDQSLGLSGNLNVFPGSHRNGHLHEYYLQTIDAGGAEPAGAEKPDVGPPTQVLLHPGDIVIAHQLLAHRVGVNYSPNIRYQLFYRLKHVEHETLGPKVLENIWLEFDEKVQAKAREL